jgi:RHS repeat-associated protein
LSQGGHVCDARIARSDDFFQATEWLRAGNTAPETKGWIGERHDGDAGLQYLNARYYDPQLGMFLQPDWWEVMEVGVGTNRFSYSFNDPVNGSDPTGHYAVYKDGKLQGQVNYGEPRWEMRECACHRSNGLTASDYAKISGALRDTARVYASELGKAGHTVNHYAMFERAFITQAWSSIVPGAMYFDEPNGTGPNLRHDLGVAAAIAYYRSAGFEVLTSGPVHVSVPGFSTPRVYDFLVRDLIQRVNIGVEVKTTMGSTIRLNYVQVQKDVVVICVGGSIVTTGAPVKGVGYHATCFGCSMIDFRSWSLRDALELAGVPFVHGSLPGAYGP